MCPAGGDPGPGLAAETSRARGNPPGGSRRVFSFEEGGRLSVRVGVFGATGYSGRELVRLLRRHPRATVAFTTGSDKGHLPHEQGLEQAADAYMLALPHGVAAKYAAQLRAARPEAVVVDLSGDLRLPTAEAYKKWYGHEHAAPELDRQGGLRAVRALPPGAARGEARLEPGLLRDVGAAAARSAAARGAREGRGHRRRRQERRDRRRPVAARRPALLRGGRRLLGLLARAQPPARRRDRECAPGPDRPIRRAHLLPAPAAREARHPHGALRRADARHSTS